MRIARKDIDLIGTLQSRPESPSGKSYQAQLLLTRSLHSWPCTDKATIDYVTHIYIGIGTSSRDSRTRIDWAQEVQQLLEVDYPQAQCVTMVCDNLNTHDIASLYHAFDAATAHRLSRRLQLIHTPVNGSWLNMAEMELSILSRQCIDRRFENVQHMINEITAWQQHRNRQNLGANWQFTTQDARIKLNRLYPND